MTDSAENSVGQQRRASRLGAVQSLYSARVGGLEIATVKSEFLAGGCLVALDELTSADIDAPEPTPPVQAESDLYADIVDGVTDRHDELAGIAENALTNRKFKDCEVVLQMLFLCGTYELVARDDIDPQLTIAEYVGITDAFFGGKEPQLVNGVLNSIAQAVRADSF